MNTSEPRPANLFLHIAVKPRPSVTMVITAATPMMMPSVVRKLRRMCRRISRRASSSVAPSIRIRRAP